MMHCLLALSTAQALFLLINWFFAATCTFVLLTTVRASPCCSSARGLHEPCVSSDAAPGCLPTCSIR